MGKPNKNGQRGAHRDISGIPVAVGTCTVAAGTHEVDRTSYFQRRDTCPRTDNTRCDIERVVKCRRRMSRGDLNDT